MTKTISIKHKNAQQKQTEINPITITITEFVTDKEITIVQEYLKIGAEYAGYNLPVMCYQGFFFETKLIYIVN